MTIQDIKKANRDAGKYFFEPATMRFFNSRILSKVHEIGGRVFFVSSERFSHESPRLYTVREFDRETGGVGTGDGFEFQEFATSSTAYRAIEGA